MSGLAAWEFWPGVDDPDSWAAFIFYQTLPPPRKLHYVADCLGLQYGQVSRWAKDAHWQARVLEWDKHIAAIRLEETEELIREDQRTVTGKHLETTRKALAVADRELAKLVQESAKSAHSTMPARDVLRLADLAIKTERLVRGQATEIQGQELDLSKLSDEELAAYEALLVKAHKAG